MSCITLRMDIKFNKQKNSFIFIYNFLVTLYIQVHGVLRPPQATSHQGSLLTASPLLGVTKLFCSVEMVEMVDATMIHMYLT